MEKGTALQQIATRLSVSEKEVQNIIMNTLMPNGGKGVSTEQFTTFIAVANEYGLNPLTKEIYAFPAKGGGIQPIVSIDGWLRIINTHPDFNGMTFEDNRDEAGDLLSITCNIFKKNTDKPIQVTEYMGECRKNTEPWKQWPARMLRHKTTIQAARYAFGLSGIVDPDEADRIVSVDGVIDAELVDDGSISDEKFEQLFVRWEGIILDGKKTPDELIAFIEGKGTILAEHHITAIKGVKENNDEAA